MSFRSVVWMREVQLWYGVSSRVRGKIIRKEYYTKTLDWLTGAEFAWCVVLPSHLRTPSHCEYLASLASVFWYIVNKPALTFIVQDVGFNPLCYGAADQYCDTQPAWLRERHGTWSVKVNILALNQQASGDPSCQFECL